MTLFSIVNSLPVDKILALAELRPFADDNFNVAQTSHFFFDLVKNIVGKEENSVFFLQPFSHFPTLFLKGLFLGVVKLEL